LSSISFFEFPFSNPVELDTITYFKMDSLGSGSYKVLNV